MKITRTFNIGEYCVGGVISLEITDNTISIINRQWDQKMGALKSSDQSNSKIINRWDFDFTNNNLLNEINDVLNDLTTSYYADLIIKWIKEYEV